MSDSNERSRNPKVTWSDVCKVELKRLELPVMDFS